MRTHFKFKLKSDAKTCSCTIVAWDKICQCPQGDITFLFHNAFCKMYVRRTLLALIRNKRFRLQSSTKRIFLLNQNVSLNHLLICWYLRFSLLKLALKHATGLQSNCLLRQPKSQNAASYVLPNMLIKF